jgi:F-type H+-transporting ATPase subunit b
MLSPLLILAQVTGHAAEATASHGEAASGITKITQDFGISIPFILAQILNFTVVALILWKFAFKPVLATLDERQKKIADGLKYAEEMQAKLAATQQESAQLIKTAQLEAQKVVNEARKIAKDFADKQQAEATTRAADILAKAQQAIELEHKKMLDQTRGEIARLVVKTTEQVLARKLTDTDRAVYNEAATKELTTI